MSLDGDMVDVNLLEVATRNKNSSERWIRIDTTGKCEALDVNKQAIVQRLQIHVRDLRLFDSNIYSPSCILCRESAIVLNLEHIKAIITAKEVLLRSSPDEDIIRVVDDFQRCLDVKNRGHRSEACWQDDDDTDEEAKNDESPFEFRALEVALKAICSFLTAKTNELMTQTYPVLDELTSKINPHNLNKARKLKSSLTRLTARVQKVRDELDNFLSDDDEMAALYLSRKLAASSLVSDSREPINWYPKSPTIAAKISRAKSNFVRSSTLVRGKGHRDIDEIDTLLEAYYTQIDHTLSKLIHLREYFSETESYFNTQLDNKRNQLIRFQVIVMAASVCLSVHSLVCGIFSMNIPVPWDKKTSMFKWVVSITVTLCGVLFGIIMSYAQSKGLLND